MDIKVVEDGAVAELTPSGKLGAFFGVKELEDTLRDYRDLTHEIKFVILNMTDVNYISSAAIRILLQTQKHLMLKKGKLLVYGLQESCHNVFKITGILNLIPVFDDHASCRAHMGKLQQASEDDAGDAPKN